MLCPETVLLTAFFSMRYLNLLLKFSTQSEKWVQDKWSSDCSLFRVNISRQLRHGMCFIFNYLVMGPNNMQTALLLMWKRNNGIRFTSIMSALCLMKSDADYSFPSPTTGSWKWSLSNSKMQSCRIAQWVLLSSGGEWGRLKSQCMRLECFCTCVHVGRLIKWWVGP